MRRGQFLIVLDLKARKAANKSIPLAPEMEILKTTATVQIRNPPFFIRGLLASIHDSSCSAHPQKHKQRTFKSKPFADHFQKKGARR